MPRITQTRIGSVYLKFLPDETKWRASWWDAKAGKHRRYRLNATSYNEARKQCAEINRKIAEDAGFLPHAEQQSANDFTVKDALMSAVSNSRGGEGQVRRYVSDANIFLHWLAKNHPAISHWSQLRPEIVEQYVGWLERKGYAYDTIRARALVLRMTSRFLVRNYFDLYRDITMGLKVTRKRPVKVRALSIDELAALLSFARANAPDTYACIVLQSLAGLRILEALNLRECDVNWRAGTIEIAETSRHCPKNLYSFRTIPVAPIVLDVLRWEIARTKIKSGEGFILNHSRGGPHRHDNMSGLIKGMLRAFSRKTGNAKATELRPHEFRATYITLARQAGADDRYLKRYVGHSPGDIMGIHYEAVTVEDMRRGVVEVFLGAYGEKLNADGLSCTVCCTIAAQTRPTDLPNGRVSVVESVVGH